MQHTRKQLKNFEFEQIKRAVVMKCVEVRGDGPMGMGRKQS